MKADLFSFTVSQSIFFSAVQQVQLIKEKAKTI